MSPSNERKLLEAILATSRNPPAIRSARMHLIGTAIWATAGFALIWVSGGLAGLTWQILASTGIGFLLGLFTYYDWYRDVRARSWPVFSPYFDLVAVERRLAELRT